jgi:cytochrome c-type biogenesis protein CcmH
LFCPVCENIPLDVCGTAACAQWRDEIRLQLESGKTDQQVIDDFVQRYGDRVVGTPQDPTLRALALITPWVISLVALGAAAFVFLRWRAEQVALSRKAAQSGVASGNQTAAARASENEYRARLERDLARRR